LSFVFDFISVSTFWTILLIVHALFAVAMLGALTHQAMSVAVPARPLATPAGFVTRFRAVYGAGYATAVCVLWVATFLLGAWIYTKYRIAIRSICKRPALNSRQTICLYSPP
jgi:carbon starvation protein CstA